MIKSASRPWMQWCLRTQTHAAYTAGTQRVRSGYTVDTHCRWAVRGHAPGERGSASGRPSHSLLLRVAILMPTHPPVQLCAQPSLHFDRDACVRMSERPGTRGLARVHASD
eukprot:189864-Pleurochrysis_carterae.AAC.1